MAKRTWAGLGTVISRAAARLGIPECPSCKGRRIALDRIVPRFLPVRTMPQGGEQATQPPAKSSGLSARAAEAARKWAHKR